MPLRPSTSATAPETWGPVVERSTKVLIAEPLTTPWAPRAVSRRMAGEGRLANTVSQASATAVGEAARAAPLAARAATAGSLTSNTVRVWPASSRREAMWPPMRPTPMKPRCCPMVFPYLEAAWNRPRSMESAIAL